MVRLLVYLFELIVVVLVVRLLSRALNSLFGTPPLGSARGQGARPARDAEAPHGETARDPVCGMFVSTDLSHRLKRDGETLHFCSRECLERYKENATQA